MTALTAPLRALLSTSITALAGYLTVLIAEHFPGAHVTRDQVASWILFSLGVVLHLLHGRQRLAALRAKLKRLLGRLGGESNPSIAALETEVARLATNLENVIHRLAATGQRPPEVVSPAPAPAPAAPPPA